MKTNVMKKGVSIQDLVHGLIRTQREELRLQLNQMEEEENRITDHKTKFETLVSGLGWTSVEEFLTKTGYRDPLTEKRKRVKLTPEQRTQVIDRLKSGKSTDEISKEFGISEDSVYSIKSKAGLTTPRTKKVISPSEPIDPNQTSLPIAA